MTGSFVDLVDLASERLGGAVVAANDEFFAPKERLIMAGAAVWREGEYTERGKWMDGWETRRRRDAGDDSHDWCVIRLGARGHRARRRRRHVVLQGQLSRRRARSMSATCRACRRPRTSTARAVARVLPRTPLTGDSHNLVAVDGRAGGDAPAAPNLSRTAASRGCASTAKSLPTGRGCGCAATSTSPPPSTAAWSSRCSDMFFGSRHNLIMPGDATHMGDGWETRRRRGPGHDWTIIRLGAAGTIRRVDVDTRHFKGNAPGACSLEACAADDALVLGQAGERRAGRSCCRARRCSRTRATPSKRRARDRRRDPRAVQHFSRRRRRPAAVVREATMKHRGARRRRSQSSGLHACSRSRRLT